MKGEPVAEPMYQGGPPTREVKSEPKKGVLFVFVIISLTMFFSYAVPPSCHKPLLVNGSRLWSLARRRR